MNTHKRVVVIGGGAVGCSILYHLALAGVTDTLLLERDELTSGSTWHAAGNIPTYATSWLGMRAGNYGWQLYKDLGDTVDSPITYRHTGAFWPAHTKERMELFGHLEGIASSAGFDLHRLSPAEMDAMHPFWSPDGTVLGGIMDPYEGDIDPSQLTQALAKGARDQGAQIKRFSPVTGIARTASGEWEVSTANETITAEIVINAGGFYGAKIAAMAGLYAPVITLEHQYLVTEPLAELDAHPDLFPLVRDPDIRFYLRRERNAFLLGSYAHAGRPAWPKDGPPDDFAHQLFPDSVEDILEVLEDTIVHVPLLAEAGAQRFVNGPIAYAPDALPLVGPAAGAPNFYHATGVQVGITHSAAIGKAMAEWITQGETEWDLSAWDPRRFGDWATPDYAHARASEHYDLQYAIPYPHRNMQSGRPLQRTPLYDRLKASGAVMGQIGGWERAFWFETPKNPDTRELSFHEEPWHAAVRGEIETVARSVGVMDHGGFTKFTVEGPGAADYLDRVFCGTLPKPGRIKLSYMLTPNGRIYSEATIARLSEDRFVLCGPTLASLRDFDWLSAQLPDTGVTLSMGHEKDGALMVMGPKSRELLAGLTSADLSASAAPWMSVAECKIAGVDVIAMRVSYVGELGWELHASSADLPTLYNAIMERGTNYDIGQFGSYALNSMRIEKGYHGWGADFGTEYTLFDAGLQGFAKADKGTFQGQAAFAQQSKAPADWEWVGIEVTEASPEPLASESIIKDGKVIGYVTSGTHGIRTGKTLVLGYVERGTLAMNEGCQVRILGQDHAAARHNPAQFDPQNLRLKQ
ncbi:4-methylaminobutanoate oxidase (formaldehyde-forming) [Falsiruegeria litorea R37]|uniref:4-methylaminobutanoate oxidase (Formaldehyde-forming) n=1 Tax=Falsiruegeria litorea R37 TaxID=1200284 RepID=A0A1Y5RQ11_9RHOB|nr:FAD-dependent oxidoreductase [Falsiruegeria litorea]SLN19769.1 4-methylaminobutanoate oxidase (formaldehyde-forming) [Falsiruegeria litorea R37]